MQTMELMERPTATEGDELSREELDLRIENIMRVKALSGRLRLMRERHFSEMMRLAQDGARSTKAANRIAASSILDMMALELCDP